MRLALNYISKLQQENKELEVHVQALESVWRLESFTNAVAWLRRTLQNIEPNLALELSDGA